MAARWFDAQRQRARENHPFRVDFAHD